MHSRTLLWISFTSVLKFNNAEGEPDRTGRPTIPPHLLFFKMNYSFPTVTKGGVLYYDLSDAREIEKIHANAQSVEGITASRPGCRVKNLLLDVPYHLDEDLLTNCPNITLRLKGRKWQCVREGLLLERSGVEANLTDAHCTDVWVYKTDQTTELDDIMKANMERAIHLLKEFRITGCSSVCDCKWYFKSYTYDVLVICEEAGLTDDTLPALPSNVINLWLKGNKLVSMDNLVAHLLPYNGTLTLIQLDDNKLDSFPTLPNGSFPNLIFLSLVRNEFKKIDIEAFKSLITRKDLVIHFEENIFPCDCTLFKFKRFLERFYLRHWRQFYSFMKTQCKIQEENKTQFVYKVSEDVCRTGIHMTEMNWWSVLISVLAILNVVVFYLMVDLAVIIRFKRHRRPTMDRIVCGVKQALRRPFR